LFRIFRKKANSAPLTDFITNLVCLVGGIAVLVLFHASPDLTEVLATIWIAQMVASLFGILWSSRTSPNPIRGTEPNPQFDSPR
jgi:hypothetical protein